MKLSTFRRLGLSIIEIIVGVSLVALVLLLMVSVIPTANLSLHRSTEIESVDTYAQEVLEYTKTTLSSQALVTPFPYPTTLGACVSTTSKPTLNNMTYVMTNTITVVDQCTAPKACVYFVYEINVVLYKTDGQNVTGSPVQVVGREMIRTAKTGAICCCCVMPPCPCCP